LNYKKITKNKKLVTGLSLLYWQWHLKRVLSCNMHYCCCRRHHRHCRCCCCCRYS